MKVSSNKFHTSLALVMLALLAACAGVPEPTTQPGSISPTSAPSSPTKAPQPTGVPTLSSSATIEPMLTAATAAPISTTTGTTTSAFPIGTFTTEAGWTWQFKADGTQNYNVPDAFPTPSFSTGTYTVTGNQIVFVESTGECGANTQGTYTWAYDGKILSFKVVKEKCGFREGTAAHGHWERQP
jgi:hypothetical protein